MLATVHLSEAKSTVRYASVPADIKAFRDKHQEDSAFIFFVDLSESQSGFLDGLFNLFLDSSSEYEIDLEESLSQNNPTMKIDLSKPVLKPAKDEYKVDVVPYLIAYHKGVEIFRGEPDLGTADAVDKIIKERNDKLVAKIDKGQTVHPERNGTDIVPNDDKNATDVHHHPKPLTVVPDYGHISTSDQPALIVASQSPITSLDSKTGANIQAQAAPPVAKSTDQLVEFKKQYTPTKAAQPVAQPISQPAAQASRPVPVQPTYPSYRTSPTSHIQARQGIQYKINERMPRNKVSSLMEGGLRRRNWN